MWLPENARNSLQNVEGGQVVIGASRGLGDGYIAEAVGTDSIYYNNHLAVWDTLGQLGAEQQAKIGWLINQKALQPYIEKGAAFEYTLRGIENVKDFEVEKQVMELIWQGKNEKEIIDALEDIKDFKTRWRELLALYDAKYEQSFDGIAKSYILVKP